MTQAFLFAVIFFNNLILSLFVSDIHIIAENTFTNFISIWVGPVIGVALHEFEQCMGPSKREINQGEYNQ